MTPAEQLILEVTGITVRLQRSLTGRISIHVPDSRDARATIAKSNWDCLRGLDRFQSEVDAAAAFVLTYLNMNCGCEFGPDGYLRNSRQLDEWELDSMESRLLLLQGQIENLTYKKRGLTYGQQD